MQVIISMCKAFIKTATAEMRRERTNAGGDDDESSEEDGAPDPAGFQAASSFKDSVKTLKIPPSSKYTADCYHLGFVCVVALSAVPASYLSKRCAEAEHDGRFWYGDFWFYDRQSSK